MVRNQLLFADIVKIRRPSPETHTSSRYQGCRMDISHRKKSGNIINEVRTGNNLHVKNDGEAAKDAIIERIRIEDSLDADDAPFYQEKEDILESAFILLIQIQTTAMP